MSAPKKKLKSTKVEKTAKSDAPDKKEHYLASRLKSHLRRKYADSGRLALEFLWSTGEWHMFRANWWYERNNEVRCNLSFFVKVKEGQDGELHIRKSK